MRPNKPGYWWFEAKDEKCYIAQFVEDMMCSTASFDYFSVDMIDDLPFFVRWLGQAHPPKKIRRYEIIMKTQWDGSLTWSDVQRKDGFFIKTDDVKEFILEDE